MSRSVAVETETAAVESPSPQSDRIARLFAMFFFVRHTRGAAKAMGDRAGIGSVVVTRRAAPVMRPGEHALITGGSSGLGLAVARRLVARGTIRAALPAMRHRGRGRLVR